MNAERFRQLLTAKGPFASVYFEDSHNTEDAGTQLDIKWRGLRKQLLEQGADITLHRNGAIGSETVDGGGYPVHKASGAETAGYGDPQLRTDEAARKNVRAVAARVTELVDRTAAEVVFIVGEVRSRSDLEAALPERIADRAIALRVGARHSGHDFDEVQEAIEAELLKWRIAIIDDVAQRFTVEIGRQSGLAAEGLGAVCSALRQGAVEILIIGDIEEATVVTDGELTTIAPNADVLSEHGAAPTTTLRADEALPFFAVSVGASLVRTDERIVPADGIGAVLRYAPTLH